MLGSLVCDDLDCLYTYSLTHRFLCILLMHALTEEKYGREVVVIPVDFSDGMEVYPNIAEQLKDLDIGVLSKLFM